MTSSPASSIDTLAAAPLPPASASLRLAATTAGLKVPSSRSSSLAWKAATGGGRRREEEEEKVEGDEEDFGVVVVDLDVEGKSTAVLLESTSRTRETRSSRRGARRLWRGESKECVPACRGGRRRKGACILRSKARASKPNFDFFCVSRKSSKPNRKRFFSSLPHSLSLSARFRELVRLQDAFFTVAASTDCLSSSRILWEFEHVVVGVAGARRFKEE